MTRTRRLAVLLAPVAVAAAALGGAATPGTAAPAAAHGPALVRHHHAAPYPRLRRALTSYAASRSGSFTVAVYDEVANRWFRFHSHQRVHTASIVKVDILETLLHRERGRLSTQQQALAKRMIEQSDNDAATALWDDDDRATGVRAYDDRLHLGQTVPDRAGYWGLTTTSASDQVRLIRELRHHSHLLDRSSRVYQRSLMRHVTSSQRWGITAGPPSDAEIGIKNGWLPVSEDHDRWVVNSIGWVIGHDRRYEIAVLTAHQPSWDHGIATIEHVSRLVWSHVRRTS